MAVPSGQREQWQRRTTQFFTDQHGREYVAEVDKETLAPVGMIVPRNFKQPVPTPSKYLNPVKGRMGVVRIDYDGWKRDLLAASNAYTRKLNKEAQDLYGAAFATMLDKNPPELLARVGSGPLPIEFVLAMEAGKSPWALGLRKADGGYYPKPKWVTPGLEARMLDALKTVWSADEAFSGALPVAAAGQFEDEAEVEAPFVAADVDTFEDEDEAPVAYVKPMDAPGADFGHVGQPVVAVLPEKRGPGRPRKHPITKG